MTDHHATPPTRPAAHQGEQMRQRRQLIQRQPSPSSGHDYLVDLRVMLSLHAPIGAAELVLRYVPDRDILLTDQLQPYWRTIEATSWQSEAEAALAILEDMNNELIPRWQQVQLRTSGAQSGEAGRMVTVEDSQPGWYNQRLIARLSPVSF